MNHFCAVMNGFVADDEKCFWPDSREVLPGHETCARMRLVPVDALVIVRDADGKWTEDKLRLIEIVILNTLGFVRAVDILDALAEAAGKQEQ